MLAPQTYMILDFTFHNYSKFNLTDYTQVPAPMARTDGPWSIVLDHNGEDLLRTSMCYTNQSSQFLEVQMTSSKDGPEPVTPWRRALNSYDTTKSRAQLGASLEPLSVEDRGLLHLYNRSAWYPADHSGRGSMAQITEVSQIC